VAVISRSESGIQSVFSHYNTLGHRTFYRGHGAFLLRTEGMERSFSRDRTPGHKSFYQGHSFLVFFWSRTENVDRFFIQEPLTWAVLSKTVSLFARNPGHGAFFQLWQDIGTRSVLSGTCSRFARDGDVERSSSCDETSGHGPFYLEHRVFCHYMPSVWVIPVKILQKTTDAKKQHRKRHEKVPRRLELRKILVSFS
jgi:hypothetical protein